MLAFDTFTPAYSFDDDSAIIDVNPGHYEVELSVLTQDSAVGEAGQATAVGSSGSRDRRTVAVRVILQDAEPSEWRPSLQANGKWRGVNVDSFCASFLDMSGLSWLERLLDEWDDLMDAALQMHASPYLATWLESEVGRLNMPIVGTGWGGGSYPIWIGSRDGSACQVVVDFRMFEEAGRWIACQ